MLSGIQMECQVDMYFDLGWCLVENINLEVVYI